MCILHNPPPYLIIIKTNMYEVHQYVPPINVCPPPINVYLPPPPTTKYTIFMHTIKLIRIILTLILFID